MKGHLLDTNYLIYLADPNANPTKKAEVLQDLALKLEDPETLLFLTPLIRYEVLRGVEWDNIEKLNTLKSALKAFQTIDINDDIADLARNLFRLDKANQKNGSKVIEKYQFDMFHFATAKENDLEILSKDRDMTAIENLFKKI
ncbi:type II toxin-antitoxin system VapC family toxin [Glaesserella parasuis]|uniref:PIN domain-containing protein n=1 Tax=Glaesserella parasuis TaxID=738 RepID=A0AAJ6AIJ7_GLAPU|nr:PIN domain-containing protein [Glaesserella parasuis]MDG6361462.1 PIN domain-containing protein [Glaesserella parasuis]MDO9815252.1 PIN domain-containing protein [Glaesserella parasuis]WGE09847.1 PIN domain-containing protein [Glaesserella parasuis]